MGKRVNIDSKQTSILKSKDMKNTDKNNLIKRTDSNLEEGDIISRPSLGRNSYKLNSNIRTRKCFIWHTNNAPIGIYGIPQEIFLNLLSYLDLILIFFGV